MFLINRTAGTPPQRLQHQLAPKADTQSRAVSCYSRGGNVPGVESSERPACVLGGQSASQAAVPGLRSRAAGACAPAACCTAHPYCNPTPPCDVLAAPVTSGLRVLHTDPPTPPHPTRGEQRLQEVLRRPAWTNHGSREAWTSPETRRGRSEGSGRLLKREGSPDAHRGYSPV